LMDPPRAVEGVFAISDSAEILEYWEHRWPTRTRRALASGPTPGRESFGPIPGSSTARLSASGVIPKDI
jgi:hypothetical protein